MDIGKGRGSARAQVHLRADGQHLCTGVRCQHVQGAKHAKVLAGVVLYLHQTREMAIRCPAVVRHFECAVSVWNYTMEVGRVLHIGGDGEGLAVACVIGKVDQPARQVLRRSGLDPALAAHHEHHTDIVKDARARRVGGRCGRLHPGLERFPAIPGNHPNQVAVGQSQLWSARERYLARHQPGIGARFVQQGL